MGDTLTARQKEVFIWTCRGLGKKGVALKLGLSVDTVKNHLHAIYRKCGVNDGTRDVKRIKALLVAVRRGWIDLDDL